MSELNTKAVEILFSFDNKQAGYSKYQEGFERAKKVLESGFQVTAPVLAYLGWNMAKETPEALSILQQCWKDGYLSQAHRERNGTGDKNPKIKVQGDDASFPANPLSWIDARKSRFQSLLLETMNVSSRDILRSILTGKPVKIEIELDFSKGIEEKGIENLKESVSTYIKGIKGQRAKERKDKKMLPIIMESGLIVEGMIIQHIMDDSFSVTMERHTFMALRQSMLEQDWLFAGNAGDDDGFGSTSHVLLKHGIPESAPLEKAKAKASK